MCVISSVNYKMYHHYSVTSDLFLIFWMSSLTVYYIDWHWDVTQWNDFFYFTKWISLFLSFSEILFFLSFSEILVFLSLSEILVFLSLSKIFVFLPLSEISVFLPLSKICVFLSFVNLSISQTCNKHKTYIFSICEWNTINNLIYSNKKLQFKFLVQCFWKKFKQN